MRYLLTAPLLLMHAITGIYQECYEIFTHSAFASNAFLQLHISSSYAKIFMRRGKQGIDLCVLI